MGLKDWRNDTEYMGYVADLLVAPAVQKLANYTQHHFSTRLEHCITVSYVSYKLAKKMNGRQRGQVCCMICFIMIGEQPSLTGAHMPGSILALQYAMPKS